MSNYIDIALLIFAIPIWMLLFWSAMMSKKFYQIYFFVAAFFIAINFFLPKQEVSSIEESSMLGVILIFLFMMFFAVVPVIHKKITKGKIVKINFAFWIITLVTFVSLYFLLIAEKISNVNVSGDIEIGNYSLMAFLILSVQSAIILRNEIRTEYF